MSWEDYLKFALDEDVLESAAIYNRNGVTLASSFDISKYDVEVENQNDPTSPNLLSYEETEQLIYGKKMPIIKAINNEGIVKHPAGLRINNNKYYTVRFDEENDY